MHNAESLCLRRSLVEPARRELPKRPALELAHEPWDLGGRGEHESVLFHGARTSSG